MIRGTIERALKNKLRRYTEPEYKTMAKPILLNESGSWAITRKRRCRIKAVGMVFLKKVWEGWTSLDKITSLDMHRELEMVSILD